MRWSPEQQWALDADRHTVVTASAGSGKTAVLVGRYIRLLLAVKDPQSIVAITFTRKAAAEMYARIAAELDRLIAAAVSAQELRLLKPLRERLSDAPISTIHSFCAQLLRRFSTEAGVLPNFTELTEAEALRLNREVAQQVLEELLLQGDEEVWALVREYGQRKTLELLVAILHSSERWILLRAALQRPIPERVEWAHQRLWELFRQHARKVAEVLVYSDSLVTKASKREEAAELSLLCARLLDELRKPPVPDLWASLWRQLREQAFTQGREPRAWLQLASPLARYLSREAKALDEVVEAWEHREEDARFLRQMQTLARLADVTFARLEQEKQERNVLDFNDLQLKALRLLEHPAVLERLRRSIQHVLVDEFQDTNPVQYALVRGLMGDEAMPGGGPQVFLVGDPKQSIYSFRDADVRVFEQARQNIVERNRNAVARGLLPRCEADALTDGDIHLPVSFRLAPELVAFINRVAGRLFLQVEEQVPYEPLVCGRPEARGSVRLLLAIEPAQGAERERLSEEELIARSLRLWVDGSEPLLLTEADGSLRRAGYGDIALITRYRRHIPRLTFALQRYGIPYIVHAGAGFFQAPEIQDLYYLLQFLLNEQDDLALAVALRSPLFALTDEELLRINLEEGETLWQRLCRSAAQEPIFREVVATLELLRLLAPRVSVAELLRTINDRTLWLLRLRQMPRLPQIQANVAKLLEFARAFQGKGFRTLADFVNELGALIEMDAPEAEAALPTGANAVNILTIHAAKGLEFPVVVLCRMADGQAGRDELLLDENLGVLTQPLRWDAETGVWVPIQTPTYVVASATNTARQKAEEQRVLYVGLTRARDHLVLAATLRETKDGGIGAVEGLFGFVVDALQLSSRELLLYSSLQLSETIESYAGGQRYQQTVELTVPIIRDVPEPEALPPRHRVWVPPIVLERPVPVRWSQERLSATQYTLFHHDPESFVRRALLGFPATPEELLQGAIIPVDTEQELPEPVILGYLLHQLLAHVTLWTTPDGELVSERLGEVVQGLIRQSPYATATMAAEWLMERASAVVRTPFLRRQWRHFWNALREYTLTIPLGENFLTGTLDVLLTTPEGREIWDWKLGKVSSAEECAQQAQWYEPQLRVYAYLVLRRFPEQPGIRARLLFVESAREGVEDAAWVWTIAWERAEVLAWENEFREVAECLFLLRDFETQ
ncbi:MAG: UvrD-helicase domain-containing protein [Candidatus Kapabacteria bacterium]|nr:UvrD-helicase domain-containing protein [Candidatus Kapabacteria bacterium]MDW8012672.1 UvrD-helicase domain-containing protein [Bacteroidota bacterium]